MTNHSQPDNRSSRDLRPSFIRRLFSVLRPPRVTQEIYPWSSWVKVDARAKELRFVDDGIIRKLSFPVMICADWPYPSRRDKNRNGYIHYVIGPTDNNRDCDIINKYAATDDDDPLYYEASIPVTGFTSYRTAFSAFWTKDCDVQAAILYPHICAEIIADVWASHVEDQMSDPKHVPDTYDINRQVSDGINALAADIQREYDDFINQRRD